MVKELASLPLRLSLRTTSLALRAAQQGAGMAVHVGEELLGRFLPGASPAPEESPRRPETRASPQRPEREAATTPEPVARDPRRRDAVAQAPAPAPAAPPRPEPVAAPVDYDTPGPIDPGAGHISEEVELVDVSADPGAADGAGAQITIGEPFKGYGKLKVEEIVDHVQAASAAELAAIRLYEASHRGRSQVLKSVDEKLGLA